MHLSYNGSSKSLRSLKNLVASTFDSLQQMNLHLNNHDLFLLHSVSYFYNNYYYHHNFMYVARTRCWANNLF